MDEEEEEPIDAETAIIAVVTTIAMALGIVGLGAMLLVGFCAMG